MAFDEKLAERMRKQLEGQDRVVEKRMFGGLAFMLNGNSCSFLVEMAASMCAGMPLLRLPAPATARSSRP